MAETRKRDWSANLYNSNANFVYSKQFTSPVLELLDAKPGDRILDMGCGSGELTTELFKAVRPGQGGLVVGVDSSEDMVARAKSIPLPHAIVADIQSPLLLQKVASYGSFSKVFTNATLHWCKASPRTVIANARALLQDAGREGKFVGEMGGFMNCIGVRGALHLALERRGISREEIARKDPWWFPNANEFEDLLRAGGFHPVHISLTPRMTPLPTGLKKWMETFVCHTFLGGFDDQEAEHIIDEVVGICEADMKDARGGWSMMYVRLRWEAYLVV